MFLSLNLFVFAWKIMYFFWGGYNLLFSTKKLKILGSGMIVFTFWVIYIFPNRNLGEFYRHEKKELHEVANRSMS
jgi:hypothetical protein